MGEIAAPPRATSLGRSGSKTRSHKRLQPVDELEKEETLSSRLMSKKAKFYGSPEPPNVEQGESASESSHSTPYPEPSPV